MSDSDDDSLFSFPLHIHLRNLVGSVVALFLFDMWLQTMLVGKVQPKKMNSTRWFFVSVHAVFGGVDAERRVGRSASRTPAIRSAQQLCICVTVSVRVHFDVTVGALYPPPSRRITRVSD